ncbi:MAG TPA: sigma-70 family RNA polymerase sigma factor, partial [Polyangia bacterium]
MTRGSEVPTAELLAHQQWVSRLARHLAGDGAEDVAQDAWVAALRSPPPDEAGAEGRPWRPWLATVLHNLVRLRWRDQTRRARREQAFHALAPDHVEAVDQAYDRVELQRFLADAMMALDEPLRVVIVLRYVEGLDASRIAEVIGSPAGTVRWRLKTALDRLRVALDARCNGDRRAWVAVLVPAPFVGTPRTATTGATTATKGTLVMASMKLKASVAAVIAIALLMIGGTALWWARVGSSPLAARNASREPDRGVTLTRGTWAPAPRSGGLVGVVQRRDGTRVDGAIVVATVSTSGAAPGWNVDPAAEPTHARSGGDGAFRIEYIAPGRYVLTATKTGAGLARAQAIAVDRQTVRDIVLTLVEGRAGLSGRVVDSGGGGIAGARVLAGVLDGNTPIGFAAITDEQGRYALDLPSGDYHFEASADGYATARFGLYLHLPLLRDFRLHPASRITGRVRARLGGEALAGAEVSVVDLQNLDRERVTRTTLADEAGRFVFASMDPGTYRLIAHRGAFVGQHPRRVVVGLA